MPSRSRSRGRASPILSPAYKTSAYLLLAGTLATHAFFFWSIRGRIAKGDPDFTVFYTAGKMVREGLGSRLYDPRTQREVQQQFATDADIRRGPLPYIHPPFEALLFLPLTFLSYRLAFVAWNVVNLGILVVIMRLLRSELGSLARVPVWLLVLISLAFFPVFANFHQGQDAILLLLLVVLGWRAMERGTEFVAGCWLGVGIFKYHLILPLVLIFAVWRGRKLLLGFSVVAATAVLVSIAIVGWQGAVQYPGYALRVVSEPALGGIPVQRLPNLLGLVAGWSLAAKAGRLAQFAVMACTVSLLVLMVRLRRAANDRRVSRLYCACAVIAAVLAGYSTNSYDLSLLVVPLAVVADYSIRELSGHPRARSWLMAPAIPLLLSPLWFFLWMMWERLNVIAVFLVWWLFAIRREIVRSQSNAERPEIESALA